MLNKNLTQLRADMESVLHATFNERSSAWDDGAEWMYDRVKREKKGGGKKNMLVTISRRYMLERNNI